MRYPNPSDPLNGEAAALLLREPANYEKKVRDYTKRYAGGDFFNQGEQSPLSSINDDLYEENDPYDMDI